MTTFNSIPSRPPNDGSLTGGTWSFLKATQSWMYKISAPQVAQTASATVSNYFFYPFDATSGNLVATLPAASSCLGKIYAIKKTDSTGHTVTVTPTGADVIDGGATYVLSAQYQAVYLISDGVSNWWLLATIGTGVANPASSIFMAGGAFSYTTPASGPGSTLIRVVLQGPGASTANGTTTATTGGGGAGEYTEWLIPVSPSTMYNGVVGTPGNNTTLTVNSVTYTASFAPAPVGSSGGQGGGRKAGAAAATGTPGGTGPDAVSNLNTGFLITSESGAGGGAAGTTSVAAAGGPGGTTGQWTPIAGGTAGATRPGGGGGANSKFGKGGVAGAGGGVTGGNGSAPAAGAYGAGAGAPGAGTTTGGTGATGATGVAIITPA